MACQIADAMADAGIPCQITRGSEFVLNMRPAGKGQMDFREARWRRADRKPVLNLDLWEQLQKLTEGREINSQWVRGHAGNPLNEEVDTMAWQAARMAAVHRKT